MLVHIHLTCIISDTKSAVILKFVPLYVLYNFTLSAFKISIYSWFWTIWLYFFSCNFHYISCAWSLLKFLAVGLYFSSDLETFQPWLFKNIFSLSRTPVLHALARSRFSYNSPMSYFVVSHFSLFLFGWFLLLRGHIHQSFLLQCPIDHKFYPVCF